MGILGEVDRGWEARQCRNPLRGEVVGRESWQWGRQWEGPHAGKGGHVPRVSHQLRDCMTWKDAAGAQNGCGFRTMW